MTAKLEFHLDQKEISERFPTLGESVTDAFLDVIIHFNRELEIISVGSTLTAYADHGKELATVDLDESQTLQLVTEERLVSKLKECSH